MIDFRVQGNNRTVQLCGPGESHFRSCSMIHWGVFLIWRKRIKNPGNRKRYSVSFGFLRWSWNPFYVEHNSFNKIRIHWEASPTNWGCLSGVSPPSPHLHDGLLNVLMIWRSHATNLFRHLLRHSLCRGFPGPILPLCLSFRPWSGDRFGAWIISFPGADPGTHRRHGWNDYPL